MEVRTTYVSIVLLSALIVAFESVAVEGALNVAELGVFLVTAIPTIVGGLILMSAKPSRTVSFVRSLGGKGWLWLVILCLFVAVGVLLWFDAVGRIGAGKEALLGGGSSEVLFVVLLSAIFLSERLTRLEAAGGLMVVVGVFLVLFNKDLSLGFGFGELEVLISSFSFGCSVVLTAALLKEYELTPLSGVELFLSGVIVLGVGIGLGLITWPGMKGLIIASLLGLFPSVGLLTYNAGLPKIGASLTSVLFALTGILTVCVQALVLLFFPDAEFLPPQNFPLAVTGGAVAFIGVYLLNIKPTAKTPSLGTKKSAEGEI